jgi:hypothetical protein
LVEASPPLRGTGSLALEWSANSELHPRKRFQIKWES